MKYTLLIIILLYNNSLLYSQNQIIETMKQIKFFPEIFGMVELGYSKTSKTICSPGYPECNTPLNTLQLNAPQKIMYDIPSDKSTIIIPICIVYNISLRRIYKYYNENMTLYIQAIDQKKNYSGEVYNEEYIGDEIPLPPVYYEQIIKERNINIKEAQKYSDKELDEGPSYQSFMNLNAITYVKISFEPGKYVIWYTFRGLESNHCHFEIVANKQKNNLNP